MAELVDEGGECENDFGLRCDELLEDFKDSVKGVSGGGHDAKMEATMWKGSTSSVSSMARSTTRWALRSEIEIPRKSYYSWVCLVEDVHQRSWRRAWWWGVKRMTNKEDGKRNTMFKNDKIIHQNFHDKLGLSSQHPIWQSFQMIFQSSHVTLVEILHLTNKSNVRTKMLAFLHIQGQKIIFHLSGTHVSQLHFQG